MADPIWIVLNQQLGSMVPFNSHDDRLQYNSGTIGWCVKQFDPSSQDYRLMSWRVRSDMLDELSSGKYVQQLKPTNKPVEKVTEKLFPKTKPAKVMPVTTQSPEKTNWEQFLLVVERKTGLSVKQIRAWTPEQLSKHLLERNNRLTRAFHEAILMPKGSVPDSGIEFYDQSSYDDEGRLL